MLLIEYQRRSHGLSQHTLAVIVRISQPWISLIEQGRFVPTPDQLVRLGHALSTPPGDLLTPVVLVDTARIASVPVAPVAPGAPHGEPV